MRHWLAGGACIGLLAIAVFAAATETEDARTTGCLPPLSLTPQSSACAPCHKDSEARWAASQYRACSPYCLSCHAKRPDIVRHHPVGVLLPAKPPAVIRLTADGRNACFTCHDLSRPRYDSTRWKSASLFDRLFRNEPRYKTYFLLMRNDQGQLCQNCH